MDTGFALEERSLGRAVADEASHQQESLLSHTQYACVHAQAYLMWSSCDLPVERRLQHSWLELLLLTIFSHRTVQIHVYPLFVIHVHVCEFTWYSIMSGPTAECF